MTKIRKFTIFLSVFIFSLLTFHLAHAARLYLEPSVNTLEVGESATLNIRLDTQGENINAIDLGILYPPLLEIRSISKSGSAIQLWVQEPNFTGTGIFFSGGSPGGIKSENALIAKITVKGKAIGEGNLQLSPVSQVLLNDGQGTEAALSMTQASFDVTAQVRKEPTSSPSPAVSGSPATPTSTTTTPEKEESEDNSRPKKFEIFVGQDPRVFNGKYFVSFFTTDKESGVDHYEIREGSGEYETAQGPYLLSDQDNRTVIRVRAYDAAGNYRESVYPNMFIRIWWWITRLIPPLFK